MGTLMRLARSLRLLALVAAVVVVCESRDVFDLGDDASTKDPGLNVADCWRLKSLVKSNGLRDGFEWAVNTIKFYEEEDCSGDPLNGTAFASSYSTTADPAERDGASANAFDGNTTTAWIAKRRDSGEYVGLRLDAAKEVKCLKVRQDDQEHGVRAAVLEKSTDCQGFARVAEFPDFPKSYTQEETFPFNGLDQLPDGVFQIRSRHDVGVCVGVTVPEDEVEDVEYGIAQREFEDGKPLLLQRCDQNAIPQFWFLDNEFKIVNVKDTSSVLTVPDAEATGDPPVARSPQEGGDVIIQRCENGCPNLNSYFKFSMNGDGMFIDRSTENFILTPRDDSLSKGTPIVTSACGTSSLGGILEQCPDKVNAQWDLLPLFTVMPGKQAVNCAPYSHQHPDELQPLVVANQWEAQRACAADKTCMVYMYVDPDAADAPPEDRGKAWLCTALDVVYAGKSGYQLGFRALNLDGP